MAIDLNSNSVSMFGFSTTVSLTDEVRKSIGELWPADKRGNGFFEEDLEGTTGRVRVIAVVSRIGRSGNKFNIAVSFHSLRRTRSNKKPVVAGPSLANLFTALSALPAESKFNCSLVSQFKRTAKVTPIVKLPLKLTEFPGAAFNEIRGIHFALKDGADWVQIILDTADDSFRLIVYFDYSHTFSQSIAEEMFIQGLKFAKLYVVRG